jgi:hypothetical protein
MKRRLRVIAAVAILGLVSVMLNSDGLYQSRASASSVDYGLLVGNVGPCTAKQFDRSTHAPLIVILMKDSATYDVYNVSADEGTTSYHFDVPAGHYGVVTTWPNSKSHRVVVTSGKTSRLSLLVSCGSFDI